MPKIAPTAGKATIFLHPPSTPPLPPCHNLSSLETPLVLSDPRSHTSLNVGPTYPTPTVDHHAPLWPPKHPAASLGKVLAELTQTAHVGHAALSLGPTLTPLGHRWCSCTCRHRQPLPQPPCIRATREWPRSLCDRRCRLWIVWALPFGTTSSIASATRALNHHRRCLGQQSPISACAGLGWPSAASAALCRWPAPATTSPDSLLSLAATVLVGFGPTVVP